MTLRRLRREVRMLDGLDVGLFSPAVTVEDLHESRCREVPTDAGVYLVLWEFDMPPEFVLRSSAGWFKGMDPSFDIEEVRRSWVPGASVLYIGKASGRKGLRQRIRQLIDFAYGKPIGHRGGRMLWHLGKFGDLEVRWKSCPGAQAECYESSLINQFRDCHGARPFANKAK